MKRILVVGDIHGGHESSVTPPDWHIALTHGNSLKARLAQIQRLHWEWYIENIKKYGPFDGIVVNGDCIEGKGAKSGGTENITNDRHEQVDIATQVIEAARSKRTDKIVMTYGTAYHTGDGEDFEDIIARALDVKKPGAHEWLDVEGVIFDIKHHCGSSSVPHARHTAVARERLSNILWNEVGNQPKGDVIIRSHVHYYNFCGGRNWVAMTTPALQGMGSKYGSRRCSGIVDFGFVVFEVNNGEYKWHPVLLEQEKVKVTPIVMR